MFSIAQDRGHQPAEPRPRTGRGSLVALAAASLMWAGPSVASTSGAIFSVDDGSGAIHLTDDGLAAGGITSLLVPGDVASESARPPRAAAAGSPARWRQRRVAVEGVIMAAARSQALDPALLHAVVSVESAYRRDAISPRGAMGLMQLMPPVARAYGVKDPFDPAQNVLAGARHLRRLLDQYSQDATLALAAYNAGAGSVRKAGRAVPAFPETTAYVGHVLARYAERTAPDRHPQGADLR